MNYYDSTCLAWLRMGDGDLSTLPARCERKSVLGFGLDLGCARQRVGPVRQSDRQSRADLAIGRNLSASVKCEPW